MKRHLLFFFILTSCTCAVSGQGFSGQWKGEFTDESSKFSGLGGDRCRYVLDLDISGKSVTGYSYTYFEEEGKTYYTICRLDGFVDHKRQYVEVTEVERTKTNVPVTVRNCFQVHRLTYTKNGEQESMSGSWNPAPKQGGGCGFGTTVLSRRSLSASYPGFNAYAGKPAVTKPKKSLASLSSQTERKNFRAPVVKDKTETDQAATLTPQSVHVEKEMVKDCATPNKIRSMPQRSENYFSRFEKRNNFLIRTIEVENRSVKIDLYDNGEIDGDSISVLYNGQVILTSKKLSGQPITLHVPVEDNGDVNQLVMYAENLGSIPPNTALMIVTDGDKRHEVRITSDLKKSGTINFVQKKNNSLNKK